MEKSSFCPLPCYCGLALLSSLCAAYREKGETTMVFTWPYAHVDLLYQLSLPHVQVQQIWCQTTNPHLVHHLLSHLQVVMKQSIIIKSSPCSTPFLKKSTQYFSSPSSSESSPLTSFSYNWASSPRKRS